MPWPRRRDRVNFVPGLRNDDYAHKLVAKELPIELLLDITLLVFLVVTAVGIAVSRDLFGCVMLSGIYGLLSASFFIVMDAVDVAFTEAAVGAGIFPLLMLAALSVTGRYEQTAPRNTVPALALLAMLCVALIVATTDIPAFGSVEAPAHQHVAPRYIQDSPEEIGIPNMVTSVLASYRAYDTLGEVVVIFTAGVGVLSLLLAAGVGSGSGATVARAANRPQPSMYEYRVLRIVSKMLIPLILIFALYVQFHGDYGPGGGFQAGVIFAAAIILYSMVFGLATAKAVFSETVLRFAAALGVVLYGSVGLVALLSGDNFLDYNGLAATPQAGQHIGILVIELGVGITVACTMVLIFFAFSSYAEDEELEP